MKTIKLKGGLGNQLYQISSIYSYCIDNNFKFFIDYSIQFGCGQGKHPRTYKDLFYKNFIIDQISKYDNVSWYKEPVHTFSEIPILEGNYIFDGYFQSYKYFQKYKNNFNNWFNINDEISNKFISKLNDLKNKHNCNKVVGVHVRRGDYLGTPHIHPSIKKQYYDIAKSNFDSDTLFVYLTDDINNLKKEFTFNENEIIISGSELDDFLTLCFCDSLIIPNSTFSGMASYLGKKKDKIFAPCLWFGPGGPDPRDTYDPEWEIINYDID